MSDDEDEAKKLNHKIDYLELIEKKDAEIERLKVRIKVLVGMLADCANDKALITELREALETWTPWSKVPELIQRAREATG